MQICSLQSFLSIFVLVSVAFMLQYTSYDFIHIVGKNKGYNMATLCLTQLYPDTTLHSYWMDLR